MTAPSPVAAPMSNTSMLLRMSGVCLLLALVLSFMDAMPMVTLIGERLAQSGYPARVGLDKTNMLGLLSNCYDFAACHTWMVALFLKEFGLWHAALLLLPVIPLVMIFTSRKPDEIGVKNPGSARWANEDDVQQYSLDANTTDNPHSGYIGQLISPGKKGKLISALPPMLLPREPWCQNTFVLGGVGSGKTTGFFQANGALAAHLGQTLILIDTKWPQSDSGLREMLGYWKALGRDVILYKPFETTGLRLPMDDNIGTFEEGLRFADAVMPPPEFQEEVGAHFKQTQRRILGAQARVNARRGQDLNALLDIALMTLEEHKEWIANINPKDSRKTGKADLELEMLSRIMYGALSRGDRDFMDNMAAILSAMRVFFNPAVMRSTTAGEDDETIVLETAFRRPTLVYFAVNQEDMLDGSGTILIRLFFRRLVQAVFRVAKTSKGGKLPHLATIQMDEMPSYGRINYLTRITGTMRSYRLAIIFGVQNNAQGELAYGKTYWGAASESVIARRVVFPRGLTGDDADDSSKRIGMTSTAQTSSGISNSNAMFGGDQRTTTTSSLQRMPLLAVEEFNTFSIGEAVVISPQHHPLRVAFTPITFPYVVNPAVKPRTANWIHEFYEEMMALIPPGVSLTDYSNGLIEREKFSKLMPSQQLMNAVEGVARTDTFKTHIVQTQSEQDRVGTLFTDWAQQVLEDGVEVLLSGQHHRYIDLTRATLPEGSQDITAFLTAKLLEPCGNYAVRLSELGRQALGPGTVQLFVDMNLLFPIWQYIEENGAVIEHHPKREAIEEKQREPVVGRLEDDGTVLSLNRNEAVRIYPNGNIPAFDVTRDGTGKRERWLHIPVHDAGAIREASLSKEDQDAHRSELAEQKLRAASRPFSRAEDQ